MRLCASFFGPAGSFLNESTVERIRPSIPTSGCPTGILARFLISVLAEARRESLAADSFANVDCAGRPVRKEATSALSSSVIPIFLPSASKSASSLAKSKSIFFLAILIVPVTSSNNFSSRRSF